MKAFDIYSWPPPGWPEPYPAVIVSNPDRVANKPEVEVLMCSSKMRGGRRNREKFYWMPPTVWSGRPFANAT